LRGAFGRVASLGDLSQSLSLHRAIGTAVVLAGSCAAPALAFRTRSEPFGWDSRAQGLVSVLGFTDTISEVLLRSAPLRSSKPRPSRGRRASGKLPVVFRRMVRTGSNVGLSKNGIGVSLREAGDSRFFSRDRESVPVGVSLCFAEGRGGSCCRSWSAGACSRLLQGEACLAALSPTDS